MIKNIFISIIFCLVISFQFCYGETGPEIEYRDCNIIFVLIDALRADHLSCYGYPRKTSPNIDKLAEESILFENCISQAWYTLPSVASIFTSRYPHNHMVTDKNLKLPENELTLAEVLKLYGYKTAAFTGGIFFEPVYGLNQGFDIYYARTAQTKGPLRLRLGKSSDIYPKALDWIEKNRNEKFFVFIHSYDLFLPTRLPARYKNIFDPGYKGVADKLLSLPRLQILKKGPDKYYYIESAKSDRFKEVKIKDPDLRHIIADYDAGIHYADSFVGELLKRIKELKLYENTIIVITADHGTDLLDHRTLRFYRGGDVYDEVSKVPLLIKYPKSMMRNKRIKKQAQLIDVMPTILDSLGIPVNKEAEGRSLMILFDNDNNTDFNKFVFSGWENTQAIRSRQWKLIYSSGRYELYDLKNDPYESDNVIEDKPEIFLEMMKPLFFWKTNVCYKYPDNQIKLGNDLVEKLKKAGYW